MCRFVASLVALTIVCAAPAAHGETRALLAAVSMYDNPEIPDLAGPANDIAAIEAVVRARGARDVTTLTDRRVTRTSIERALHDLGERSRTGDWIVFYYAGHGAEAEAEIKGTRDGDTNQFIPLSGFDEMHQDPERFIVDKDFYAWLARYIPPDVHVLMIADTCHSGTLNRSVDPAARHVTARLAFRDSRAVFRLAPRPGPRFSPITGATAETVASAGGERAVDRPDLANLVFIGAAQDDQTAGETELPAAGAPSRGYLSWAIEQGLTAAGSDGRHLAADANRDGHVSVVELAAWLDSQVRMLSAQQQQPRTTYVAAEADLALLDGDAPPLFSPPLFSPPAPLGPVRPAVFAVGGGAAMLTEGSGQPWRKVASAAAADFHWDTDNASVSRRSGDIVAQAIDTPAALTGVIDKWNTLDALRPLISERALRVTIGPQANGARYAPGAHVSIRIRHAPSATPLYLTVFDLASDGTVQLLYPQSAADGDGALGAGGDLPLLETRVVAPFGADHVVAIALPRPPADLRALIRGIDGQRLAVRLAGPVRDALKDGGEVSIGELYTGP